MDRQSVARRGTFLICLGLMLLSVGSCGEASNSAPETGVASVEEPNPMFTDLPNGEIRVGMPKEGLSLDQVIKLTESKFGLRFASLSKELGSLSITMIGTKDVPRKYMVNFLQVLFFAQNLAVVPVLEDGVNVLHIKDVKTSVTLGSFK